MPKETRKSLPPAARKKAERLEAAYDAFLAEMGVLKKERNALLGRIRERLERGKIDEIRASIKKMK